MLMATLQTWIYFAFLDEFVQNVTISQLRAIMVFWLWLFQKLDLFIELDQNYAFPANYLLNVSSGSRYGDELKGKVLQLDCTR